MPGNPHAQTQIGAGEARCQLAMMLLNCTEERLAGFTADGLSRMYRVKPAEIGQLLEQERERRAEYERRRHG
jgi:hypothetical protein